jgi:hypothetical protein
MALYRRGKGRFDDEYGQLWTRLVPRAGQAKTVQGELVRAIGRLASESYRNGNVNWDADFRSLVVYLKKHLADPEVFDAKTIARIKKDLHDIASIGNGTEGFAYPDGEDLYDRITDRVVEWCQKHPKSIQHAKIPKLRR